MTLVGKYFTSSNVSSVHRPSCSTDVKLRQIDDYEPELHRQLLLQQRFWPILDMMCLSHLSRARTLARDGLERSTNGALRMERFVVDLGLPRGDAGGSFGRIHALSSE